MQAEVLFEELVERSSLSYLVRTCQIELECNITERKSCVTDASWSLDWKLGAGVFSFHLKTDGTLLRNFTDLQVSPPILPSQFCIKLRNASMGSMMIRHRCVKDVVSSILRPGDLAFSTSWLGVGDEEGMQNGTSPLCVWVCVCVHFPLTQKWRNYTLIYLKWITNKSLLYSTWNSAQCYVTAWMGGEFGGEWMHAWLSLYTVYLKLS